MAGDEYYRAAECQTVGCCYPFDFGVGFVKNESVDSRMEVNFAAVVNDSLANCFDYNRQAVGSDMRVSIDKDVVACAVGVENLKDFFNRTSFCGTGVEFSVGESSGSAFAEAIV